VEGPPAHPAGFPINPATPDKKRKNPRGLNPAEVLAFPKIQATIRDNGAAEVVVAGNSRNVASAESLPQLCENALAVVVGEAKTLNRPVRVAIDDPEGHGELLVSPDGSKESVGYTAKVGRRRAEAPTTAAASAVAAVSETAPVGPPGPSSPMCMTVAPTPR
jgi:hypothetical protein